MQEALLIPEIRPERFLDPSAGTGMFISTLKDVPEIHCFEKDRLTGRILSSLYPESKVTIEGFQSIQPYYNGYFDVVLPISRLGNTRIYDRDFDRSDDPVRKSSLAAVHNYFFLKGMDTLREGGILAYITTSGVMDSPQEPSRQGVAGKPCQSRFYHPSAGQSVYRCGYGSGQRPDRIAEEYPKIGTDRKGTELY